MYTCGKASRRLYVLRVLKPLFNHDLLVNVFHSIIRSLLEYACPVFLNPGTVFDLKLTSLCKRAFQIIHGRECSHCNDCELMNVQARRRLLSMRLFTQALDNSDHSLHSLLPMRSNTSHGTRLLLPHVRCERRLKAFTL